MTLTQEQTVAEIAATALAAVRVFETHGIDYCCGGHRPLQDVCAEKGLAADLLVGELESALAGRTAIERDWKAAPLRELIAHIVSTHHEYLKLEFPRLQQRLDKVFANYGQKDAATLTTLPEIFFGMRQEMEMHMHKEERVLFPFIEQYENAVNRGEPAPPVPFGSIGNPIRMMEFEHESAGEALRGMRETTRNYAIPPHACTTYRALFEGLQELERDLHLHIHLENNILFPRALELETMR